MRIFADRDKKMNLNIKEVKGEILVVSQFTLYGDCQGGNRPSFIKAAPKSQSLPLYELFIKRLKEQYFWIRHQLFHVMHNLIAKNISEL